MNQINKSDEAVYRKLWKRYYEVREGEYSEEEKNDYYAELESEITRAQDLGKINRGQLRLSERVCRFLALGQKIQLPEFEKDHLTLLAEAIKKRVPAAEPTHQEAYQAALQEVKNSEVQEKAEEIPEPVKESSVQAVEQETRSKEAQEKIDKELKSARDELAKLVDDSEKIEKGFDDLRQAGSKLIGEKAPEKFEDFQKKYYTPRRNKLFELHDEIVKRQDILNENYDKMEEFRQNIDELLEQTSDAETKRQTAELLKRHDRLVNERYTVTGANLDDALLDEKNKLEREDRERKNSRIRDKVKQAGSLAIEWLDKYDRSFDEKDLSKQIEILKELKASSVNVKRVMPTDKVIKIIMEKTEKVVDYYDGKNVTESVVRHVDEELENYYERSKKLMGWINKYVGEMDTLIDSIEHEQKFDKIRSKLKDEYKSFTTLNNPERTKDEFAQEFQKYMKDYLEKYSDVNNEYATSERQNSSYNFLVSSKEYVDHLNKKIEGTNAREALRAYQEKVVIKEMLQTMVQLPEFYEENSLKDRIEKENARSIDDKKMAENAVAKLKTQNDEVHEKLVRERNALKEYVVGKRESILKTMEDTDGLEIVDKTRVDEKKSEVTAISKEVEEKQKLQGDAEKAFEDAKDKEHTNDEKTVRANEHEKSELAETKNRTDAKLEELGRKRDDLEGSVDLIANHKLSDKKSEKENKIKSMDAVVDKRMLSIFTDEYDLRDKMHDAEEGKDADGVSDLSEVTKKYDLQSEYQEKLEKESALAHDELEKEDREAIAISNEIKKLHDEATEKNKLIEQNLTETRDAYNKLKDKLDATAKKQQELREELLVKQHEDAIRREIKEAFDAVKDSKDRGIGSHEKFNNFKAAMQHYLEAHPDGHPNENLSAEDAKNLRDSAYQSCIEYVNRHLKTSKGLQSLGHQGTNEGALRKQGTVRILELMNELPEFKDKFELKQDAPQVEEKAPAAKADANNDKRVKLNFNQLKESLGKNSKTVKTKKKEDFSKNAYADLNAEISKKANKEDKGDKGKQR